MKYCISIPALVFSLCLSILSGNAQSPGDRYIFPDPANPFVIAGSMPEKDGMICGKLMNPADSLARAILEDLRQPFNWQMIRISQCARNFMKNTAGPNLLLVSGNEGGFPRKGITLLNPGGPDMTYPELHYVDLVLDLQKVAQGNLSIYTHELGHVMMELVLGDKLEQLTLGRSPKQHVSMGVTDYVTAFTEGWGVHFQRLAYDRTEKYRQAFESRFVPERSASLAWHSGLDEQLRLNLVRENGYIYGKVMPEGPDTRNLDLVQRILLEHTSPLFDHTQLKNAQQMLSCEGVLATVFYQVGNDAVLAGHYQAADWYSPFLVRPLPAGTGPADVFSPLENLMIKQLYVWKQMARMEITGSPLMTWLTAWCTEFPDDREELVRLFIRLTQGVTVDNELADVARKVSYYGQIGDFRQFLDARTAWQAAFRKTVAACLDDPSRLQANMGPEIWITSKTVRIRRTLWMPEPTEPLAVNLNTAGEAEMEAFLDPGQAEAFIRLRQEKGFFRNPEEIEKEGFQLKNFSF